MKLGVLFLLLPALLFGSDLVFSDDEDLTMCHHVNVISGNLNLCFQDAVIEGAKELPLVRTYTSAGALEERDEGFDRRLGDWVIQGGWNLMPHAHLLVQWTGEEGKGVEAYLPEKSGAVIQYVVSGKEKNGDYVLTPKIEAGQCSGILSARTNPKNNVLKLNGKGTKATLYLPDGGQRNYAYEYEPDGAYFLRIQNEVLPSGHFVQYDYQKGEGTLRNVSVKNPGRSKVLSGFDYKVLKEGSGSHHFRFQIHTTDGRFYDYRSTNLKYRNYLSDVESNCRPRENCGFVMGKKVGARMHTLHLGDRHQLSVHYNKRKKEKKGKDYSGDKVERVEAPIGGSGEVLPLARFSYGKNVTDVRDVDGILTRYHHDNNRLDEIVYFNDRDQPSHRLRLVWEGAQLKAKVMLDAGGAPLFSRNFAYDGAGNVIEESLWGNLTGKGAENYRKRYAYLPGFNVPLVEEEEEGPTYRYEYVPGTNLMASKFVCDGDKILMRHFFYYDGDHLLVRETVDNGTDSERRTTSYELDPATGMRTAMVQTYLDAGQEKLIRRTEYTYSLQKKVIAEKVFNADGVHVYTLHTDYDAFGHAVRKTTPLRQANTYRYDANGNLLECKEVCSPRKTYSYQATGRPLTCEEHFDDHVKVTRSSYDAKGRLLTQTDTQGNSTVQQYDCFGQCVASQFAKVEEGQPTVRFTYDIHGNLASTTNPRGETTRTTYNVLRKPTLVVHPDGSEERHFYRKNGVPERTIYADGTEIHYTHDVLQRKTSRIVYGVDGAVLEEEYWEYDPFRLLAHTDVRGLLTTYSYDGAGRLVMENAGGRIKTYAYDALGFLERTSDGETAKVEIHDVGGRVVHTWTELPSGARENEMRFVYDEENRKTAAYRLTSQGETLDSFAYDTEGRLTAHIDPLGEKTEFLYREIEDAFGQHVLQKTTIDPCGNIAVETYDALSRLVWLEKKSPEGKTAAKERYFYDGAGNRIKRVTSVYEQDKHLRDICTTWEYDSFGRVLKEVESDQRVTSYTYDIRGRLRSKTLPSQIIFTYFHDGLGRLLKQQSSDGTVHYQYVYNGPDPVEIIDLVKNTRLQRIYNLFGELVQEVNALGNVTEWRYDPLGRKQSLILPDRSSVHYTYAEGHMSAVQRYSAQGDLRYAHHYSKFDVNGHVQEEELIHGLGRSVTSHDCVERPLSFESPWLQHSASYGHSGLVIGTENTLLGSKKYAYDPLNQLIQEGEEAYAFDSVGNPSHCHVNDCNQILATPDCALTYDGDGNPTARTGSGETTKYTYDALGRLTQIDKPDRKVTYTYDPLSRLLSKEIQSVHWFWRTTSIEKVFYLYDQEIEIGTMTDSLQVIDFKTLGLGIKGDIGAAVAIECPDGIFAPLHDFNGHVVALVSSAGMIAKTYQMNAFGKDKSESDTINPWRFCSKRCEEGLIFFGKRFYDPSLGRWLTPDPAGFADGPNLYVYVLNSPLNRLDLFGFSSIDKSSWWADTDVKVDVYIRDILSSSLKELLSCKGSVGDVQIDFYVSCGHWHKIQFSPEELNAGKINVFDHLHEIMPKEGVSIGLVTAQNGIKNSHGDFRGMSESIIGNLTESVLYMGMYNPTEGLFNDLQRVKEEMKGLETPIVSHTRQFMEAIIDSIHNINPSLLWMHVTHSEGGLIGYRAIEGMNPERREMVKEHLLSFSVGPAKPIPEEFAKKATNIYSSKDGITKRYAKPYRNDPNYDIKIVKCLSSRSEMNFWMFDHAFLGTTYQTELNKFMEDSRRSYGIYNEKR